MASQDSRRSATNLGDHTTMARARQLIMRKHQFMVPDTLRKVVQIITPLLLRQAQAQVKVKE